jgi:hypothetical protein
MGSPQPCMSDCVPLDKSWDQLCIPRIGIAALTRLAFQGTDLYPLWTQLMETVTDDAAGAGIGMDLSVIAQLRGDKSTGLAIQRDSLKLHQIFRCQKDAHQGPLRVLALAAASDIGANTPMEFLLEGSGISLATLYIGPDVPLPQVLPAHDVAMVVAPASEDGAFALTAIEQLTRGWGTPLLNPPARIRELERDRLYRNLAGIEDLLIPATWRLSRKRLKEEAPDFPVIIRPLGSHAGFGLARIDDAGTLADYLAGRQEEHFFVSPFLNYASGDGLYRKYRVALIGGQPYPVHMAVAEEWKVWYLNADMALNEDNRLQEANFLQGFENGFVARHGAALQAMARRIGLDYVLIDCAETQKGALVVFEADHCAIVHDMDPVNVYPYKPPAMQKIFSAFATMLTERARAARAA